MPRNIIGPESLGLLPALIYTQQCSESGRRICEVQGQAFAITGHSSEQLLADANCFVHPEDLQRVSSFFSFLKNEDYQINYRVIVAGATQWVTDKGRLISDGCYIGFISDATESIESERQLEQILAHQTKELEEAKKLLESSIHQQALDAEQQIFDLQQSQYRQAITYEVSTCDSVARGDMNEASVIVCDKLRSGLEVDEVLYYSVVNDTVFSLMAKSRVKLSAGSKIAASLPQSFVDKLSDSLCLDFNSIKNADLDPDVVYVLSKECQIDGLLLFPLKVNDTVEGFLCVVTKAPRQWAIEEIIFVSTLVDQLKNTQLNHDKLNAHQKLQQLAYFDSLTGLQNRTAYYENVKSLLRESKATDYHAFMYIDLDEFKQVNDTLGHDAGDTLLVHLSNMLRQATRGTDQLARVGGDEFNALLFNVRSKDNAAAIADKFLSLIAKPIDLAGQQYSMQASIGLCLFPEDVTTLTDAILTSDQAMYHSKLQGKNQYTFFSDIKEVLEDT